MRPKPATNEFSTRLRATREQKGLSQADLAARSGLQPSAVSHFEAGRRAPSFENLRSLADALAVTTDYLLGRRQENVAVGPAAERMLREFSRMTNADQECLAEIARVLTRRGRGKS